MTLGPSIRHANRFLCPHCGYVLDASSGLTTGGSPTPGDATICIDCAGAAIYQRAGLTTFLRLPTPEELAELQATPAFVVATATIKKMMRRRKKRPPGRSRGA
jgi:hypothetical protein